MKKTKVLGTLLLTIVMLVSMFVPAAATSYTYSCKKSESVEYKDSGPTYRLEVLYDYGTWVPTDNARIRGVAGAEVFKARQVAYRLNDGSTDTGEVVDQSFSAIGSGIQNLTCGDELDNDEATGYVIARVYNGYSFVSGKPCTYQQTVAHSSRLDVK